MPDCLLLNWFPIKKKGIYKILTPVSFVGRVAKCSCFIYSNMFQKQFHKEMKVVCFSVLSSAPTFLSRSVSPINNSSKTLVNLTKFATEKQTSLQLTLNSYMVRKIRQIIFLLFYVKDLLTTGKNSWKTANSNSKGSTSNPLQVALLTRYGGKVGITLK